eukprot:5647661-Ditylum_brightwellii.AAC.1
MSLLIYKHMKFRQWTMDTQRHTNNGIGVLICIGSYDPSELSYIQITVESRVGFIARSEMLGAWQCRR